MSAVIYRLPHAELPPSSADEVSPGPEKVGSSAARWGVESVVAIVQRMLDSADDALFDLAEKTASEVERKVFFDSMRLLRRSGPALIEGFRIRLTGGSRRKVGPGRLDDLALLDDQAVEDDISIARTVGRIESAAKQPLWELAVRVENVPAEAGLRRQFQALLPPALANAFRDSLRETGVGAPTHLILFKLYERQFLADAHPFYQGLNQWMDAEGYAGTASARRYDPSADAEASASGPDSIYQPAGSGPPVPPAAAQYIVPAQLRSMLGGTGQSPGVAGAAHHSTQAVAYAAPAGVQYLPASVLGSEGGVQRITLVSQLLDEIGRQWDPAELEALRRLVLPLVRVAIADGGFFRDAQHPARALIAGLSDPAAGDGARDRKIAEIEHALRSMQVEDSAPDDPGPLAPADLLQFLGALRAPRADTQARVIQAREAAHRQIKSIGSGRDLPEGIGAFLTEIWLPMVSAINLRFGADSPEWTTTSEMLERLFAQCRWIPTQHDPSLIAQILDEIETTLGTMSIPPRLVAKAKALLADGLGSPQRSRTLLDLETFKPRKPAEATAREKAASAPPGARPAAYPGTSQDWRAAVPVSAWFRVYDHESDRTLWLSAEVLYPQATKVSFVGFDPAVRVTVDRRDFLEDLACGKSEPVDPRKEQIAAIQRLCAMIKPAGERSGQGQQPEKSPG